MTGKWYWILPGFQKDKTAEAIWENQKAREIGRVRGRWRDNIGG